MQLPQTWQHLALEKLALSVDYGLTASADGYASGPKFLRITDIRDDAVDWSKVPYCEASRNAEETCRLAIGDIVFARTGATTGKSFLVTACPARAVFASYLIRVRPDTNAVEPRYLAWYFKTPEYWRQILSSTSGTAQPGVNASKLKLLVVPTPPLDVQHRIADILDKADAIRRKRKEVIALTEELLRSAFLEIFGDPMTNPKGWPTCVLSEVCALVRGSSPRPKGDPRYYGGPVPRLMVADMTRDGLYVTPRIDSLTVEGAKLSRPVPAGTVVMAVSGNVGVPARLEVDACIHDGFVAFTELQNLGPDFLLTLLSIMEPVWKADQAGAIFQNLTTTDVKRRTVILPSPEMQDQFSKFFAKHRQLVSRIQISERAADELFDSMVYRAFSGSLAPASAATTHKVRRFQTRGL